MNVNRATAMTGALLVLLSACGRAERAVPQALVTSSAAGPSSAGPPTPFTTAAFAAIRDEPVGQDRSAALHAALRRMFLDEGGMSAMVLSPEGTWSGVVGKADGVRDVQVEDQFAIASVTKTVVAAQVMQMVEAGELGLEDPAADHLPTGLGFDTNAATIRHLLGHRSGIPDYYDKVEPHVAAAPQRAWTTADLLRAVPTERVPAGTAFDYSDTNYLLLGLVIEQVRGRPVAAVLREGVLRVAGTERLIYQPAERPTAPMALPGGQSRAAFERGGGYLPSLGGSTSDGPGAAMASDAPSLARWWRAFCQGRVVSPASLTEMTTFRDDYGLGVYNPAEGYAQGIGHTGRHIGYVAWAGCLTENGSVVVVLSNRPVKDIGLMAQPLVRAVLGR